MNCTIVSGSPRKEAQTLKVARFTQRFLETHHPESRAELVSLSGNPLPLWDEDAGGPPEKLWKPIAEKLRASDALVVVTPEWNGMTPPGLRNFLHFCGADLVAHRPAAIIAVSAGTGGAYPVAELRMAGYKNNRLCYLPEHLIVRDAKNVFNTDTPEPGNKSDAYLHRRLAYLLRLLEAYAHALQKVRESGIIDHESFPNGM